MTHRIRTESSTTSPLDRRVVGGTNRRSIGATVCGTALLAATAVLSGCGSVDDAPAWRPVTADATASTEATTAASAARADAAIAALGGELMSALGTALKADGPAAAIEVCSELAPSLAERIGRESGVAIGRTSFRLRNAENEPPPWAREAVEAHASESLLLAHDDGRVARLLPIRLTATCLQCHGAAEQLAPGVPDALASLYPDDRATGFAEGEVRGYFWVEVPASE